MKAIEVKRGDKVRREGEKVTVIHKHLNCVIVEDVKGYLYELSYQQIEKYEQTQINKKKP